MDKLWIYLDDLRTPTDKSWIVVRTYDELVALVESKGLDAIALISLDHDLGDSAMVEYTRSLVTKKINYDRIQEKTGFHAAKFLVELSMNTETPLPTVYVHSINPVGANNIMNYINGYLRSCGLPENCRWWKVEFKIDYPEYEVDD